MARLRLTSICAPAFVLAASSALAACGDDSSGNTTASDDTTTGGETDPTTTGVDSDPDTSSGPGGDTTTTMGATTEADTTAGDTEQSACGDGVVDEGEDCDDSNTDDGDGCSSECAVEDGWACEGEPSTCSTECGDEIVAGDEECDDGNDVDTDECTNACAAATCGDGIVWEGMEGCDDGNTDDGDGCSAECEVEAGIVCDDAEPANCFPAAFLASGTEGGVGNLWAISLDGATTLDLGVLDVGLTGMAFHPDGTLYAVSSTQYGNFGPSQLGIIDYNAVTFTPIGPLVDEAGTAHDAMPDITFMGTTLLAWTEDSDSLAMIDLGTGMVTVTPTSQGSSGTALAYDPIADEVLLAPDGSAGALFTVDDLGNSTAGATLLGGAGSIRGMAFSEGTLYGMDFSGGKPVFGGGGGTPGSFVTFDVATGNVTELAMLPAVNIDALAVFDPGNEAVVPEPPKPKPEPPMP